MIIRTSLIRALVSLSRQDQYCRPLFIYKYIYIYIYIYIREKREGRRETKERMFKRCGRKGKGGSRRGEPAL